jgi:hypothetical protein
MMIHPTSDRTAITQALATGADGTSTPPFLGHCDVPFEKKGY